MKIKPLLLFTILFLFGVNTIPACDCRNLGTIAEEFNNTAAVFSGKVIAREYQNITDVSDYDFGNKVLTVRLKVDKWWRGSGSSEIVLRTGIAKVPGGTRRNSCDFLFNAEESYLVFANFQKDWLKTRDCTRTKVLSKAGEDLKELGEGFQPKEFSNILETVPF